ncbi:hypothetical protein F4703DRAFT_1975307 [Phycomyces blakesleeanus]
MYLSTKQPNLSVLTDSIRDIPATSTQKISHTLPLAALPLPYGSPSSITNSTPIYSQMAQVDYNKSKTICTAVLIEDNDENATPQVYRRGTTSHSVIYHLPSNFGDLDRFLGPLQQVYPRRIGRQLKTKTEKTHTAIELCLSNDIYCKQTGRGTIQVSDQQLLAIPAISADLKLFLVNLSGLPADDYDNIAAQLRKCLSPYGNVCETIIFEEGQHQWFKGNKYVYLERPVVSPKVWAQLTYQIKYSKNIQIYGTWAKMGDHCVFCKQMGHTIDSFPERRKKTHTCHNCGVAGHIQIHCIREPATNLHQKAQLDENPRTLLVTCCAITPATILRQT